MPTAPITTFVQPNTIKMALTARRAVKAFLGATSDTIGGVRSGSSVFMKPSLNLVSESPDISLNNLYHYPLSWNFSGETK